MMAPTGDAETKLNAGAQPSPVQWYQNQFYTVSQKNVPPSTCYNLDIHDPIKIIFGRSVTEKVTK